MARGKELDGTTVLTDSDVQVKLLKLSARGSSKGGSLLFETYTTAKCWGWSPNVCPRCSSCCIQKFPVSITRNYERDLCSTRRRIIMRLHLLNAHH